MVHLPPPLNSSFGAILYLDIKEVQTQVFFTNHCFPLFLAIPGNCKTLPRRTLFFPCRGHAPLLVVSPYCTPTPTTPSVVVLYHSQTSFIGAPYRRFYIYGGVGVMAGWQGEDRAVCGDASAVSTAFGGVGSPGGIHIARS